MKTLLTLTALIAIAGSASASAQDRTAAQAQEIEARYEASVIEVRRMYENYQNGPAVWCERLKQQRLHGVRDAKLTAAQVTELLDSCAKLRARWDEQFALAARVAASDRKLADDARKVAEYRELAAAERRKMEDERAADEVRSRTLQNLAATASGSSSGQRWLEQRAANEQREAAERSNALLQQQADDARRQAEALQRTYQQEALRRQGQQDMLETARRHCIGCN